MAKSFNNAVGQSMIDRAAKKGAYIPGQQVRRTDYSLWHAVNIPVGGVATPLEFFQETPNPLYGNYPQPGQISANNIHVWDTMCLHWVPGFDRDGNVLGIAAPTAAEYIAGSLSFSNFGTTLTADQATRLTQLHERSRQFLESGVVRYFDRTNEVINFRGLSAFPSGRGQYSLAAANGAFGPPTSGATGAYAQQFFSQLSNGPGVIGNINKFKRPITIVPSSNFKVQITWPKTITWNTTNYGPFDTLTNAVSAGHIVCELRGYSEITG